VASAFCSVDDLRTSFVATAGAVEPALYVRPVSCLLTDENVVIRAPGAAQLGGWSVSKSVPKDCRPASSRSHVTRPDSRRRGLLLATCTGRSPVHGGERLGSSLGVSIRERRRSTLPCPVCDSGHRLEVDVGGDDPEVFTLRGVDPAVHDGGCRSRADRTGTPMARRTHRPGGTRAERGSHRA